MKAIAVILDFSTSFGCLAYSQEELPGRFLYLTVSLFVLGKISGGAILVENISLATTFFCGKIDNDPR